MSMLERVMLERVTRELAGQLYQNKPDNSPSHNGLAQWESDCMAVADALYNTEGVNKDRFLKLCGAR